MERTLLLKPNETVVHSILYSFCLFIVTIVLLTSSFDSIGGISSGVGNIRISLLLIPILGLLMLFMVFQQPLIIPKAFGRICLWTLMNAVFLSNIDFHPRAISFVLWLSLYVLGIFLFTNLFNTKEKLIQICRIHYCCFVTLAAWGLFTLLAALMGLFLPGVAPIGGMYRFCAFCYEPSFYSVYLVTGWTMGLFFVSRPQYALFTPSFTRISFTLISLAMILCHARSGYVMMLLILCTLPLLLPKTEFFVATRKLIKKWLKIFLTFLIGMVLIFSSGTVFQGIGVAGASASSVDQRWLDMTILWDMLSENPLSGYSLGGISLELTRRQHKDMNDPQVVRHHQGVNVTLEIICATGIIGTLVFFWYLFHFLPRRKDLESEEITHFLLFANSAALIAQFAQLQVSQNILRNYFWWQLAIVSALFTYCARHTLVQQPQITKNARQSRYL